MLIASDCFASILGSQAAMCTSWKPSYVDCCLTAAAWSARVAEVTTDRRLSICVPQTLCARRETMYFLCVECIANEFSVCFSSTLICFSFYGLRKLRGMFQEQLLEERSWNRPRERSWNRPFRN